jgi:UDP-3-O-[3-hydroxymyristoyl] glucosamine N-acyltransferase
LTIQNIADVARLVAGRIVGAEETLVTGVSNVDEAQHGDLVFAESARFLVRACRSKASAVLTTEAVLAESGTVEKPLVVVENARLAFMQVLEDMMPALQTPQGVHPQAYVASSAVLEEGVCVGAGVTIEEGARVGRGSVLFSGVYVGHGVEIGEETILHPNVVLYTGVKVGKRVVLHAGVVIGADGFGYVPVGQMLRKVPHLGSVEIGDDVEIGANSCVDRSKTGITRIGAGTKIDNLVQIAHNCTVGRSCAIAALTGIGGGVTLGDGVLMGGQSGAKDQISIGSGARITGRGGATGDVPAGETYSSFPGRPHRRVLKEWASVAQLPDALHSMKQMERRIAELEQRLAGKDEVKE